MKHAAQFEAYDQDQESAQVDIIPKERLKSAVAQLCYYDGKLHASTIGEMVEAANRVSQGLLSESTIRGLIRYLIELKDEKTGQALLPLRVHYFFKNFEGLWACSNPNCKGGNNDTSIGKLFANQRVLCNECGSRVLELLICQTCGDLFFGGYKQRFSEVSHSWYISTDYQMLDKLPEKGIKHRNFETYTVFWPRKQRPATAHMRGGKGWWLQSGVDVKWTAGHLNYSEGKLMPESTNYNGYLFFAQIDSTANKLSHIPKYCPNCGDYWSFRGEDYSPIRELGTGLQKVIQILTQTLQATIKDQSKRKTIIFSDSRQDAAKYAVGIQGSHYQDMIRLIVIETMKKRGADPYVATVSNFQSPKPDFRRAIRHLRKRYAEQQQFLDSIEDAFDDHKPLTTDQINQLSTLGSNYPFTVLQKDCFNEFIELGMNPGGLETRSRSLGKKLTEINGYRTNGKNFAIGMRNP